MKQPLQKFYDFLDRPLFMSARLVLALSVIPLAFAISQPLWKISMQAPQYPDGLWMEIYPYKLEAGNDGQHLAEINNLNHYIGMQTIDRTTLSDLDWIPFALGGLVLLTLRVAAIGNVRSLLDLSVITTYVSLFAFGRFAYTLYTFGHNLDPRAPMNVPGFMPPLLGTKQIANFTTHSMPRLGSLLLGVFVALLIGMTLWHLIAGRRQAARAEAEAARTGATAATSSPAG
jgi:copper chaperone NosL